MSENEFEEMEVFVEGEVENESGEDQSYVEVVATIYDEDGVVLGDEWDNVTDLRAGTRGRSRAITSRRRCSLAPTELQITAS